MINYSHFGSVASSLAFHFISWVSLKGKMNNLLSKNKELGWVFSC